MLTKSAFIVLPVIPLLLASDNENWITNASNSVRCKLHYFKSTTSSRLGTSYIIWTDAIIPTVAVLLE